MTYRFNASTRTTPTVVPSAAALARAASHSSSGTRSVRTGVPALGIDGDGRLSVAGGDDAAVREPHARDLRLAAAELVNAGDLVGERAGLAVDREHDVTDGELAECGLSGCGHAGTLARVYYGCQDFRLTSCHYPDRVIG